MRGGSNGTIDIPGSANGRPDASEASNLRSNRSPGAKFDYGYSNYGETQKRTLESADIKGIQTLYGI